MAKEMRINGTKEHIDNLFHLLRFNGIEATIPAVDPKDMYTMYCMPSVLLDKILPSWRDAVSCKIVIKKGA